MLLRGKFQANLVQRIFARKLLCFPTYVKKKKYHSSLTAPHILDLMLLLTSNLSPNIDELLANKTLNRSH